ncbi:DUF1941-domain-containing protein [Trichodelitschia bisporula]|uniref:DUF1941-domain-containing protein n=1 Tax=Trichodelitschia bisporula TaxID=703511 RepID=A0A6G1HY01_9PEZI|nr:DUF1941-domain-containing protein [Trichodelitschia bisporula]
MSTDGAHPVSSEAALDQIVPLLKARDDTSRFVGLSLLRSLLDSDEQLRTNPQTVSSCWDAVPGTFLHRLLKSKGMGEKEAGMRHLAAAIIHIFTNLLPTEKVQEEKMIKFVSPLIRISPNIVESSRPDVLQTLQCIASNPPGAAAFISTPPEDTEAFFHLANQSQSTLKETVRLLWLLQKDGNLDGSGRKAWDKMFGTLLEACKGTDPTPIFEAVAESLTRSHVNANRSKIESEPLWLPELFSMVRRSVLERPALRTRRAIVALVGSLLQSCSASVNLPPLLFHEAATSTKTPSKPFSYIFTTLVLIDVRSTIPSLMEMSADTYSITALRLAASFDTLCAFVLYLFQLLEGDDSTDLAASGLTPDLLLKLRKDFGETLSLTLEYFRDRWDSTQDTGSEPKKIMSSSEDDPRMQPQKDPIFVAGLRLLALWLREDDGTALREQAVGIMDVFTSLYRSSTLGSASVDFRDPLIAALSALVHTEEAAQAFLDNDGWSVLADDLRRSVQPGQPYSVDVRGILDVLISVLESGAVAKSKESWMALVSLLSSLEPPTENIQLDQALAGYQLVEALVSKAPKKLRQASKSQCELLRNQAAKALETHRSRLPPDTVEALEDVIHNLGEIIE